ncbi:MAG: recombination protein RecR [Bacteroidetes bacterium RIFCSPLOWO2_02_FULL_36_8]|nr:MAG: recombination protein RecR [Bacteroidetes bacterium RIFCSPLOWO2_02_FULL_36_8]OFY71670.1 MAG: recombination protein RecR [Bacteroidetes bacterium RIFCSPLOWO2_12_FULL_37_12]
MTYPSRYIESAVNEISRLPGIGKKTALRMVLHLFNEPVENTMKLSQALLDMRTKINHCHLCKNISDGEECDICTNPKRNRELLCIVESARDVMAIEKTSQYPGLYYVLGGIISPVNGISPDDINIPGLIQRINNNEVKEIIMGLSPTMDGDTTIYYLSKKIREIKTHEELHITTMARGIPVGGELEFTDEITLGRSILNRNEVK